MKHSKKTAKAKASPLDAFEFVDKKVRRSEWLRLIMADHKLIQQMPAQELRFLVDWFYQIQELRTITENQERAAQQSGEPGVFISWQAAEFRNYEADIDHLLKLYIKETELNQGLINWCDQVTGLGHRLTIGLLAHIDMTQAKSAGSLWSFAGLDPNMKWNRADKVTSVMQEVLGRKGGTLSDDEVLELCEHFHRKFNTIIKYSTESTAKKKGYTWKSVSTAISRRPFNARLKKLCYLISDQFVKNSRRESCYYGQRYREFKAEEMLANRRGENKARARHELRTKNYSKGTTTYKALSDDKLSDGHIDARARRRAVKLFLSHYFEVGYYDLHGVGAPLAWVLEFGGHSEYIPPPHWEENPALVKKPRSPSRRRA